MKGFLVKLYDKSGVCIFAVRVPELKEPPLVISVGERTFCLTLDGEYRETRPHCVEASEVLHS